MQLGFFPHKYFQGSHKMTCEAGEKAKIGLCIHNQECAYVSSSVTLSFSHARSRQFFHLKTISHDKQLAGVQAMDDAIFSILFILIGIMSPSHLFSSVVDPILND